MARSRIVKPDFFLDYELDQLSEAHQKLFIGLWCLSDKEGKLLDEPRKIKAQVFPYRTYDVDEMLWELHDEGFIHRYEVGGRAVIKVIEFRKHQRPHPKEQALDIPDPSEPWKKTASREKKRQEINDRPSIPSSPGVSFSSSSSSSFSNPQPTAGVGEAGELLDGLDAIHREVKGTGFEPPVADQRELQRVLRHGQAEILRRWRIALDTDYPRCWTLGQLAKHWDAYAKPPLSRDKPKDVRRDPIRAEDMKHSDQVGEIHDF